MQRPGGETGCPSGTIEGSASPKNQGPGPWKRAGRGLAGELSQVVDSRWRSLQGLAGRESTGVCHKVAPRFRGMVNRKPLIQQYRVRSLQAWKRSSGELAKRFSRQEPRCAFHFGEILCSSAWGRIFLPGPWGWMNPALLLFLAPVAAGEKSGVALRPDPRFLAFTLGEV